MVKLVRKGVVTLLMDIAKGDLGCPSIKSMEGLAHISLVKDCRTIIIFVKTPCIFRRICDITHCALGHSLALG
jgi:hypothetical protein